uniref:Aldo_ket_red domain-containing protein n=1 Tax=Caenorhabditis japonica TaxID=281687 RepID=A0A8R1IH23_CAEJA
EAPHRDEALAMECALDAGIRNFDCGQIFKSQKTIGKVIGKYIQSGKLQRKDLFLSSKVWNTHHSFDKCIEAVEICLQELRVTYLDLMLIHYPMATQICELPNFMQTYEAATDIDYLETYRALERCVQLGKVREIGVCNFNEAQTNRILENAVILPSVCQSELS